MCKMTEGALRGVPAEGVAEKPKALERGGDFPLINNIDLLKIHIDTFLYVMYFNI